MPSFLAAYAAEWIASITIESILSNFVTSFVLGQLSRALTDSPEQQANLSATGAGAGRLVSVRQPISYWQVIYGRKRVPGVITFMEVTPNNLDLHLVITWAGHQCQEIEGFYFGEELVTITNVASGECSGIFAGGWATIFNSLGDESVQPFPSLVAQSAGKWTDAHRQTGHTKSHIRLTFSADKFPNGIPNITAIVKGHNEIYDPRTATRGYSANPALCAAHYLENDKFGFDAELLEDVDQAQLEAAANDCDDLVALAAGGTEARYALSMVFTCAEKPADVLQQIADAMAGRLAHVGASWYVFAGVYEAPTIELDETDLAGPIRSQSLVSMQEACNSVKGVFTDPASKWQPTDFPALVSDTSIEEDSGVQRWDELRLAGTVSSVTQAQRLSKIRLLRARQGETLSAAFKLSALQVIAGGTVALTIAKYGYTSKPFDVNSFAFDIGEAGELTIRLDLRETAAAIYDWDTDEEQAQDLAANTNLPDPFTVGVPGAPVITETQYETRAGSGVKSKALIEWSAADDAMVVSYVFRYKLAADSDYIETAPRRSLSAELLDLTPDVYDFGVKALNLYGVSSDYSTTRREIRGLTVAPADLTGVSMQAAGGLAIIRWDLHPDLFVREGGFIEWRHTEATFALAVWEESFSIGERVAGNGNQVALPLKPGTYLGKAVSQTDRRSDNAVGVATKQASGFNWVNISTLQEDATFSGTHHNTAAPDAMLKLAGTGLIDAAPNFDTITNLDSLGGIAGAGSYDFAAGLDLGSVQRVRLTSRIVGTVANVNDLIDARTGDVDEWEDFDGNAGAVADAYVEVRETDNDPAGSPVWTEWKRLDAAEFQLRGAQFRAQLLTADDSYNVLINELRVAVAQVY